jgi:uncharacterized protein (TIGR03437 family)
MRSLLLLSASVFLAVCAQAQPVIRTGSVVNAANNLPSAYPNAGLAQGGVFILKGRGLGARGTTLPSSFPLPTTMNGTSMRISVRGTTVDVPMVYVVGGLSDSQGGFDQLAGIAPSNTPTGDGTITVTYNNQTSAPAPVTIRANAFGIFTIGQAGTGPGVFTDTSFGVNTFIHAAHSGDLVFIWGTGLGPISGNDANAPPVGDLNVPVEVYVGGVRASIRYQGRSGCCAGIDQILIEIPRGVQGCFVPVVVKIGNTVSNFTTISIAASGNVCSDPAGFRVADLQNAGAGLTVGSVILLRVSPRFTLPTGTIQGNVDVGFGQFQKYSAAGAIASQRGAVGSGGFPSASCTVFAYDPTSEFFEELLYFPPDPAPGVDAGPAVNITGPVGSRQLVRGSDFFYRPSEDILGGGLPPLTPVLPDFLVPGNFTASNGSGGADAGAFSTALTIPSVPANVWANQDAIFNIPRSQDLTVTFNPPGGNVVLGLVGLSAAPGAGAVFLCLVPSGATSFTVPSYVLSALPASGLASDVPGVRLGYLSVAVAAANPGRFQTRGIDAGFFNWVQLTMKNVNFQ